MPWSKFSLKSPQCPLKVYLDTGNPKLIQTLDGVVKIGGVGAMHAASQEVFTVMRKGRPRKMSSSHQLLLLNPMSPDENISSRQDLEKIVAKAGKEGLQWGMVTGIYAGIGYTMEKVRGKHDWKNAAVGGALTGALLSFGDTRFNQDKMIRTALTASALATASEFLKLM